MYKIIFSIKVENFKNFYIQITEYMPVSSFLILAIINVFFGLYVNPS